MNLTCYIVDDEEHGITVLKRQVESTPGLELVGSDADPLDALQNIAASGWPDILFLDIEMAEIRVCRWPSLVTLPPK